MELIPDLTKIIEENETSLLRYAIRLLSDVEYARDAVQETFIRFIRSTRKKLENGEDNIANPKALMFTILRNYCYDYLRSKKRKMEIFIDEDRDIADFADTTNARPDVEMSKAEQMQLIKEKINSLDPRAREIVILKLEHEKSYKEIASLLDISTSNVGFILHQSMKKIATELRGQV